MDSNADDEDQGHRYGNFPNYYSFHPPQNRLQVLEQTNILTYIRNGLHGSLSDDRGERGNNAKSVVGDGDADVTADDDDANESRRKIPRREKPTRPATRTKPRDIYYYDLGCNEGDLTMAMATSLIRETQSSNGNVGQHRDVHEKDSTADESSSSTIGESSTVAVAVKCLGLDLDPKLIERANAKLSADGSHPASGCSGKEQPKSEAKATQSSDRDKVTATFKACDLCREAEHNDACASYIEGASSIGEACDIANETAEFSDGEPRSAIVPSFHLTTVFSTTMWIHVHGGDDGLRRFLSRACQWTRKFLLIEPQPSGCYRKANVRLRKMGRPELDDVTSSRLAMRPDIGREIDEVVRRCGFRRVTLDGMTTTTDGGEKEERDSAVTSWNRTLHLYERADAE